MLFTNSSKTGFLASRLNFIRYPESDLIRIKEITLLWDWTLPGLGRISSGKGIEENLTISVDYWQCVLVRIYKMV